MKIKSKSGYKQQTENGQFSEDYDDGYQTQKKWYDEFPPDAKSFKPVTDQVLIELKDEAKKCLDSEVASFNIKNVKNNADYQWMKTMMSKGTVSDKIAANTILIQNNPVYNLETVRSMINMVKVGKKKECIAVMETLSELFLSDLLRPNIKLKPFHQRPLSLISELSSGNIVTRRKILCYWYFEDQLKESYTTFVQALNTAAHDTVDSNKEKAIAAMSRLLAGNAEQEKNLLGHVVNKMGDPSQKVASKTMYCLTQLLKQHSNMQGVVLKEMEKLLFRQNIGHKAQYYSLCFLSQFYLNHEAPEVARKLIEVYFSFFKKCIKEGDVDSRMMSALLIGVNRAYPYAKLEMEKISEHIDTMYRVVHVANFNVSLHALALLYQVSEFSDNINDRFYAALYKKLMDPAVGTSTSQTMLLNLIYKGILRDNETTRVMAFIKRLLQISLYVHPNFTCGILFLVSEIMSKKENVKLMEFKQIEVEGFDDDDDDDDGEEKYADVKDESDEEKNVEKDVDEDVKPDDIVPNAAPSWYHCGVEKKNTEKSVKNYNPLSRNPLYTGAEFSAYIELNELRNHYHPSVSMFAQKILNGERIIYSGDPLKDFTLIRFLDRFVFKNPKKSGEMEKNATTPIFGKRKMYVAKGLKSLPVTSSNYLNENPKNIPVDELFMFTYLQKKYKDRETKDDDDSDVDSVASEEFEEMLNKMSGYKDLDDDIDFMNDIGETMTKSKSKKRKKTDDEEVENEEGSDDEELDEVSEDEELDEEDDAQSFDEGDDEMNEEDEELLKDLDDDDDSDLVFDSDEEDDSKYKKTKKLGKMKVDPSSIFASAEEFASILEDEGSSKRAPGSAQQMENKDKADVKQLDWEEKRNRWLNGYSKAVGGPHKGKKNFKGKNKSNDNKRPGKGGPPNKRKRF